MIHPSHALTHPIRAFLLAGAGAAVLTIAVLGALSAATGAPWWAPLNATTHVFHGGEAAQVTAADWRHTGVGTIIHVLSCFFWALVALIILLLLRRGIGRGLPMPWLAAGLTVLLAALVDYGLMPSRLTPGWELELSTPGVDAGFVALGVGFMPGLLAAARPEEPATPPAAVHEPTPGPVPDSMPRSALDQRRHPGPDRIDQRMQRIDPAGKHTSDPGGPGDYGPSVDPEPEGKTDR